METITATSAERELLKKVVEAGVALVSIHSVPTLLQKFVELARDLAGARYSALGVLAADGKSLSAFYTSGISEEQRAHLMNLPIGRGVLGQLINDPKPLRLRKLKDHPASSGLPDNHPHMESFVGVPVIYRHKVFGNLYCTEKADGSEFSEDDVAILQMLAAQAAAALESAELRQGRDRFFAAASHELGNAVAGVKLWTQHLIDKCGRDESPTITEGLRKVYKGAENAHKLIDDLLSLARIQEGRLVLAPWPTEASAIVADVCEQFRPEMESARLTLDAGAIEHGVLIETDPARLRQVVVNLMSNAIKFTGRGSAITVGLKREPEQVRIWITDQGPGIAPEDIERIFMPYEQVSGVARGRGTGLGLPLSRQLARLMGGDLFASSQVGEGATFVLVLPLKAKS